MRRTALLPVLVLLVGWVAAMPTAWAQGADRVTVCHKPGTPAEQAITVASAALEAHLGHGDHEGDCRAVAVDACTAINSGTLANLTFQGTEVVHLQLWFSDGGSHTLQPTVCDAGGTCARIPLWGSWGLYADFTFDWKAGGLWQDGPITIGWSVSAEPARQVISCRHP